MPFVRRRGAGLLGMAARTAVVAGTATAVNHKMQNRYATKAEEQAAQEQQIYEAGQQSVQQQAPPPVAAAPAPAAPAAGEQSVIDQLKELAQLKDQGILTEEEFAAQKAKLLG
jgi:hypothetical protein